MRLTVTLCLLVGLAACGTKVAQPAGATLSVYSKWPPERPASPVEIRLSPAEWETVRPLLPNLESGERKKWKNDVPRLTLILLAADGKEVAQGTFEDPKRVRMTFPDHTSTFHTVSPDLQTRLIEIAKNRGRWEQ